jgi:pyruvate formate lyase activating enzyme
MKRGCMTGSIFDIQRFSIHDGPGIRTTVFMKGCSLRCQWCHNPESFSGKAELEFFTGKCTSCGRCVAVCPEKAMSAGPDGLHWNRGLCRSCFSCVDACLNDARIRVGEERDSADIMKTVLRDMPFYKNSGGGVTFSGGEPLLQVDFLADMLGIAKENGMHTAVETAGNVSEKSFDRILTLVDLFLFDLKLMDREKHIKATSASNERILENLQRIDKAGAGLLVRIPVIPGINDDDENMEATAAFLTEKTSVRQVELLPYHNMADHKYAGLGLEKTTITFPRLSPDKLDLLNGILRRHGINGVN